MSFTPDLVTGWDDYCPCCLEEDQDYDDAEAYPRTDREGEGAQRGPAL